MAIPCVLMAFMTIACDLDDDGADPFLGHDSGGAGIARCHSRSDCDDDGLGGYACLFDGVPASVPPGQMKDASVPTAVLDATVRDLDARVELEFDAHSDAAALSPANPVLTGPTTAPETSTDTNAVSNTPTGICSKVCRSVDCVNPTHVCTSDDADGVCRAGCDKSRPQCGVDHFCDFARRRCLPATGECGPGGECAFQDTRIEDKATATCKNSFCRIEPHPQPMAANIRKYHDTPPVEVDSSLLNARVLSSEVAQFNMRAYPPNDADAVVYLIATTVPSDLMFDSSLVWSAYLTPAAARNGARIADGGSFDAEQRWTRTEPLLMSNADGPYFFVAAAFKKARLIAISQAVPFTIGDPYLQEQQACALPDNQFCGPTIVPLVCFQSKCRRPCLSDGDCTGSQSCRSATTLTSRICR